MAIVSITGETVQFTHNDIGASTGKGKYLTEQSLASVLAAAIQNYAISGLNVPTGASLTQQISAGSAFVGGYRVTAPATNLTFGGSATSYVFLSVVKDGDGLVTEAVFEVTTSTSPTNPDYLLLARVTTSGSAVTAVEGLAPRSSSSGSELNAVTAMGF